MAVLTTSGFILTILVALMVVSDQQTTEGPDVSVCNRTLDLILVIDGSNSIGSETFRAAMQTISNGIDLLVVDEANVRVGAVLYSSKVTEFLELQTDKDIFQRTVSAFEYPDEATFTNLGIDKAVELLLSAERRNNTPITIMILTDGAASDPEAAAHSALVAQSQGIDMWAVGVGGQAIMTELFRYATNGSQQTFMIESYQILAERLLNLTREVCTLTETRPTFIIPTSTPSAGTESTTVAAETTLDAASSTTEVLPDSTTTEMLPDSTTTEVLPNSTTTTEMLPDSTTTEMLPESTTTEMLPDSTTTEMLPESTTTPTSVEPTPRATESPSVNETDKYIELCKNSITVGGVGYVLYPGDCTKVLQCYYNPNTNKTLVVTRQCPSGKFWDQTCLKCVDSWKVDCPYDKCKTNSCSGGCPSVDTYPMNGVCGGFWSCSNGRSNPKCCPPCYSYMAGYGCKFGNTCFDKCGPQEECADGLGVCEMIPIWDNSTVYAVASTTLGLQQTTCFRSNFSIVGCKCHIRLMDIFMQAGQECQPYHEVNSTLECSGVAENLPIKQKNSAGSLAFKIRINVSKPQFAISSTPTSSECDSPAKLKIWADEQGIQASLGDTTSGGVLTTVLFQNVTGDLEILVLLHQGLLTLGVTRDKVQYVSTVRATSNRLCTDCIHNFSVSSASKDDCQVTEVVIYNCQPEITNIYMPS